MEVVMQSPLIRAFFDPPTNTVSYLVWDPDTLTAAVIDPVLDFDMPSGRAATGSVERILAEPAALDLNITWVLETHAHADHLSGAPLIKARTGARIGIGEHIAQVQTIFRPIFDATDVKPGGGDFDRLLADGDTVSLGNLTVEVIYGPGHTPADVAYKITDCVFVGDTLFMPDYGTARADFPGGDPKQLYHSIRRLLALPPETRLFMCHDYKAPGREEFAWETTVAEQRAHNIHVHDSVTEQEFVARRLARDATLSTPRLLLPAIQVNIRGGKFPAAAANGVRYLLIPVTTA
jgi:glyoxylase-like metal-dependent hydrolase (beta-lactamase superfamily II)